MKKIDIIKEKINKLKKVKRKLVEVIKLEKRMNEILINTEMIIQNDETPERFDRYELEKFYCDIDMIAPFSTDDYFQNHLTGLYHGLLKLIWLMIIIYNMFLVKWLVNKCI